LSTRLLLLSEREVLQQMNGRLESVHVYLRELYNVKRALLFIKTHPASPRTMRIVMKLAKFPKNQPMTRKWK
jgi:hypothetical protein